MPKAVYHSGYYYKHSCLHWDSNMCPLTPQSGTLLLNNCKLCL